MALGLCSVLPEHDYHYQSISRGFDSDYNKKYTLFTLVDTRYTKDYAVFMLIDTAYTMHYVVFSGIDTKEYLLVYTNK